MLSLGPGTVVITVVALIWVVARQVQARPLVAKTLFTAPAVIAVLGLLLLARGARSGHGLAAAGPAWIAAGLAGSDRAEQRPVLDDQESGRR